MTKKTEQTPAEAEEAKLDAHMADAFGTNIDFDAHPGAEDHITSLDRELEDEADEDQDAPGDQGDEGDDTDDDDQDDDQDDDDDEGDLADDDDQDDDQDDDDDDQDDDTGDDDESSQGDDDGESKDGEANTDEGDGAAETLSDGQVALDMMIDQKLAAYVAPSDDFDPAIVGTEQEFIQDTQESFGPDYDKDLSEKIGKANYKSAMRRATRTHESGAKQRLLNRRDADSANLLAQSNRLKNTIGEKEVLRVANRMAVIYQEKVDATSVDAANTIPVEVYFRRAGGRMTAPKQKGKSKPGVASKQAKAEKRKALQAQSNPDQIGNARKPGRKGGKKDQSMAELEAHLNTQASLQAMLFGE